MTLELINEEQTIELLARSEEALGQLYECYTELFAEDAAFYGKLAKDEAVHGRWVRSLIPRVAKGQVTFREGRFNPEIFTTYYEYLLRRLQEARATPPSRLDALAIAVDMETTLVERNFYQVFESSDPEGDRTLRILEHSADAHQRLTRQRWQLANL